VQHATQICEMIVMSLTIYWSQD